MWDKMQGDKVGRDRQGPGAAAGSPAWSGGLALQGRAGTLLG